MATTTRDIRLLYPEGRAITADEVRRWAADVATDIERANDRARGLEMSDDDAMRTWRRHYTERSLYECKALLEDEGLATFAEAIDE
jgi:hypothetical protein